MQYKEKEENIFFLSIFQWICKGRTTSLAAAMSLQQIARILFSSAPNDIRDVNFFVVEIYQTSEVNSLTCGSSESCISKIMDCVITLILKNLCYY